MRALISGASSGIGYATALELQRREWEVFAGVRDWNRARREGALQNPLQLDVRDFGRYDWPCPENLDAVVACAGYSLWGPLEAVTCTELDELLHVNVLGVHNVVRRALPSLRERRGRVVIVGSTVTPTVGSGAYALSKAALRSYAETLRVELEPFKVPVYLVTPGKVATGYARNRQFTSELLSDVGRLYLDAHDVRIPPRVRSGESPVEHVAADIADFCDNRW